MIQNCNELLTTIINSELADLNIKFRLLDLHDGENKIFMKVKGNILIQDKNVTLFIFRAFNLALRLSVDADFELRIFYK